MCYYFQERVFRSTACSTSCAGSGILSTLRVHVLRATNLPDTDGFFSGDPDPFTRVTAIQGLSLASKTQNTDTIGGNENPIWNQVLSFGCGQWRFIEVSVWDSDSGGDDQLIPVRRFPICNTGRCSITYSSSEATLFFDIEVIPQQLQNECASSNPCLNGGTCVDTPCGFQCDCTFGYEGDQCENEIEFVCGGNGNDPLNICS